MADLTGGGWLVPGRRLKKKVVWKNSNEPHPRAQNESSAAFLGGPCSAQLQRPFYTARGYRLRTAPPGPW